MIESVEELAEALYETGPTWVQGGNPTWAGAPEGMRERVRKQAQALIASGKVRFASEVPDVEIVREINKPARCRVRVGGVLVFQGSDDSATRAEEKTR